MPPAKPPSERLVRKHVHFDPDDWEWIRTHFGESVGISKAIRLMVQKFRQNIEARAAAASRPATEISDGAE